MPPDESPAVLYVDDEPINLRVFKANFDFRPANAEHDRSRVARTNPGDRPGCAADGDHRLLRHASRDGRGESRAGVALFRQAVGEGGASIRARILAADLHPSVKAA